MGANLTECIKFVKSFVIKFLVVKKCKIYEIYREKVAYIQRNYVLVRNIYKWEKPWSAMMNLSQKDSPQRGNTRALR